MLRLNLVTAGEKLVDKSDSNTTNVKVKRSNKYHLISPIYNSNTTNVKVKRWAVKSWHAVCFHSNTTNVKVKQWQIQEH